MIFKSLASSSKANSYILSDNFTTIVIEAGLGVKELREAVDLTSVSGVLITHEHKDHSKYAKDLLAYAPIYASKGTLENIDVELSYKTKIITPGKPFDIGTFTIQGFSAEHDAAEPLYFFIYSKKLRETFLFATDTYFIRNRFKRLDYIAVECNYQKEILDQNIDSGKLSKVVAKRLLSSHFEISNVVNFLKANDLTETKRIYLLHLSDGNSDEWLFKKTIEQATGVPTEICQKHYSRKKGF